MRKYHWDHREEILVKKNARYRSWEPAVKREKSLLANYGITLEQYNRMYEEQQGACAICLVQFPMLEVDHDHETGQVRGLLCGNCNKAAGLLQDDPQIAERLRQYLLRHAAS